MNSLTCILFLLFLLVAIFAVCQKKELTANFMRQLIASNTLVNLNQPNSLIVLGTNNKVVKWTVSPESYTIIKQQGDKIIISFSKHGVYTISASVNNGKPFNKDISCIELTDGFAGIVVTNESIIVAPKYDELPVA